MAEEQTTLNKESGVKSPLKINLLIAGFVAGVIGIECLLAYLFIPNAEDVAALAEQKMTRKLPANLDPTELDGVADDSKSTVEAELGKFTITVSQPNSNTTLRVDFHLIGTVLEEDEKEMKSVFDRNIHRFRDQILYEIRNSEPADLADPGLGLIKRRILEKSNALFGKPLLRSIVFSEFSYVEQ